MVDGQTAGGAATAAPHESDGSEARLARARDGDLLRLAAVGPWQTRCLAKVERELARLAEGARGARRARIDFAGMTAFDTAGAWLVLRTRKGLEAAGLAVELTGLGADDERLLATVEEHDRPPPPRPRRAGPLVRFVGEVGQGVFGQAGNVKLLVNFLGLTVITLGRSMAQPWRIRWKAVLAHMETSGVKALPIVGLISFLIGIVLAYQGAEQLARFGAQIYTVNIVGVRSGSAYTAQIGAMHVNEEIDALKTLGLDPMEILVIPRVVALCLVLPLLAFYADLMGLLGGAVMASLQLDISIPQFILQLRDAVSPEDLFVGIFKALPFAFIIATVGCFEGFRVSRSAESVGHATTRAVVEGVFLVIVLDALLSIFFQIIGV
jgi:phospholipid/cholesterol/gamma-HCH transport system permease protein